MKFNHNIDRSNPKIHDTAKKSKYMFSVPSVIFYVAKKYHGIGHKPWYIEHWINTPKPFVIFHRCSSMMMLKNYRFRVFFRHILMPLVNFRFSVHNKIKFNWKNILPCIESSQYKARSRFHKLKDKMPFCCIYNWINWFNCIIYISEISLKIIHYEI